LLILNYMGVIFFVAYLQSQERLTSAELHDKDAYIRELEHRVIELLDEVSLDFNTDVCFNV